MAGHSKWANIKFKKASQDIKRGKEFTKLIRAITIAAKMGGGDPALNPSLRTAIDKGLSSNLPRDNIDRAIKRATGGDVTDNLEEIRYEGYGAAGVAIIVECLTDNRKRTVSEVRHAFAKHNGNLGTDGSVAYLFTKIGQIILADACREEQVMDLILDFSVEDLITQDDGTMEIRTDPNDFLDVKAKLVAAGLHPLFAEITMEPSMYVEVAGSVSEQVIKLINHLEDLDDVQTVYTNADFRD
jgi:YebC/PmpR family DNA-binding regulatory protein